MAYSTPRTWVAGEYPTAAQFNANVRDNVGFLANAPACRVYASGTQSITTATNTPITFNTENFDNDSMHSTSSLTSRMTINTAGVYIFSGTAEWASNVTGGRSTFLIVNASTTIATESTNSPGTGTFDQTVTGVWKPIVGDYVELWVAQASGGNLNVQGIAFAANWVSLG